MKIKPPGDSVRANYIFQRYMRTIPTSRCNKQIVQLNNRKMRFSIKKITFTLLVTLGISYCICYVWLLPSGYGELVGQQRRLQETFIWSSFLNDVEGNWWQDWNNNRFQNDETFSGAFRTTLDITSSIDICNETTSIVLCVFSRPSNLQRRHAIRATWANSSLMSMEKAALWFVIGIPEENDDIAIAEEARRYQDVIIGNFIDSPSNDTIKFIFASYIVVIQCPTVKEVFFGYDNTYVNVRHLLRRTNRQEVNSVGKWRGFLRQHISSQIKNRFLMSGEEYPLETYSPFCSLQEGFTISASLGKDIIFVARNSHIYRSPGNFLGSIAHMVKMQVVHDESFGSEQITPNRSSCSVRRDMVTFTYSSDHERHWQELVNREELLKCLVPDVDIVRGPTVDNEPYFEQVLKYMINNTTICAVSEHQTRPPFVLATISSHAEHFTQRAAIRATWASQNMFFGKTVRFVFILGIIGGESAEEVQDNVREESIQYGDIVQGNIIESFRNLTLKVTLGLKWAADYCPDAGYLYKGDDDMFVSWKRLISSLLEISDLSGKELMSRFFMGSLMVESGRITDERSRYFVNETVYRGKYYPPYCSGGSYVLSMDIIPELYREACTTSLIPMEDAYQGILAGLIGVNPLDHPGFHVFTWDRNICFVPDERAITLHGFNTPESLLDAWTVYQGLYWPEYCVGLYSRLH